MRSRGEGEIDAIVRRGARSTIVIDEGHDRRVRSSDNRAARRSPTLSSRSSDNRAPRRSPAFSSSSLSLSDLGSFFSLSLSLFPEMI